MPSYKSRKKCKSGKYCTVNEQYWFKFNWNECSTFPIIRAMINATMCPIQKNCSTTRFPAQNTAFVNCIICQKVKTTWSKALKSANLHVEIHRPKYYRECKWDTATDYTKRTIGKHCAPVTEQTETPNPAVVRYLTFIWQTPSTCNLTKVLSSNVLNRGRYWLLSQGNAYNKVN